MYGIEDEEKRSENALPLTKATRLAPLEEGRYNLGFTPLLTPNKLGTMMPEVDASTLALDPGLKYIWVLDQFGHLNMGVSQPIRDRAAFAWAGEHDAFSQRKFGHPTLRSNADTDDTAVILGGECLYSEKEKVWVVNDGSGRYGAKSGLSDEHVRHLLAMVSSIMGAILTKNGRFAFRAKAASEGTPLAWGCESHLHYTRLIMNFSVSQGDWLAALSVDHPDKIPPPLESLYANASAAAGALLAMKHSGSAHSDHSLGKPLRV